MKLTHKNHYTLIANFFHSAVMDALPFIPISGGQFYCGSEYMTERSGLQANLFIYTISGKGKIQYRGQEIALLPGTAIVLNCEEYQYYATEGGQNQEWNFLWVHFRGSGFATCDPLLNEGTLRVCYPPYDTVKRIFDQLDANAQASCIDADLASSQLLYQLLCELLRAKHNKTTVLSQSTRDTITAAATYLRNHYTQDISVEQLSAFHHISKYHFIRLFKQQHHQTPHAYLTNIRMMQAKKMLTTTALSVEEIAVAVGFQDATSFIKVFKKKTGETPSRFRNAFVF